MRIINKQDFDERNLAFNQKIKFFLRDLLIAFHKNFLRDWIYSIVRSDTFVKAGVFKTQFDSGDGMKFLLGLGKTYFLTKRIGFRVTASGNYFQTIIDGTKSFNLGLTLETGVVAYLF